MGQRILQECVAGLERQFFCCTTVFRKPVNWTHIEARSLRVGNGAVTASAHRLRGTVEAVVVAKQTGRACRTSRCRKPRRARGPSKARSVIAWAVRWYRSAQQQPGQQRKQQ
jgi:hypothetical protein